MLARKHVFWMSAAALALLAFAAGLLPRLNAANAVKSASSETQDNLTEEETGVLLFPELDILSVTQVRVESPERTFDFEFRAGGDVSVNGQVADREVSQTMLSQIAALHVRDAQTACETPEGAPSLSLLVRTDAHTFSARFYITDDQGSALVVREDTQDETRSVTKAWHVGKLLITCDGTRIQDENGRETAAW